MSVSTYQSRANKLRADIASLRKKLAQEKDKEARKNKELTSTMRSLAKTKSASTLRMKENKANSLRAEIVKIQKSIADLESKVGNKSKELSRYEQRLSQAEAREDKSRRAEELRHARALTREQRRHVQTLRQGLSEEFPDYESPLEEREDVKYDVFISHAYQDKEDFVEPLAQLLSDMGFKVWYDKFVLTVGDSLREKINKGIASSEYGLVVLSPHFFEKSWTNLELNGLTAREVAGRKKLILPIWHNVGFEDVLEYSPVLADKKALDTRDMDLEQIAEAIAEVLPGRLSEEEEDRLDAEEADAVLSDPSEERIPWETLKREMTD